MTLIGLGVGIAASFSMIQYLATLLYGISSHDWLTFVTVSITITVIAVVACLVPALRAARIDPLSAMRGM